MPSCFNAACQSASKAAPVPALSPTCSNSFPTSPARSLDIAPAAVTIDSLTFPSPSARAAAANRPTSAATSRVLVPISKRGNPDLAISACRPVAASISSAIAHKRSSSRPGKPGKLADAAAERSIRASAGSPAAVPALAPTADSHSLQNASDGTRRDGGGSSQSCSDAWTMLSWLAFHARADAKIKQGEPEFLSETA